MEYIVKGIFIDTKVSEALRIKNCEALIKDGIIKEFSPHFDNDENLPVYDYENKIIIPGLIDLHLHAPQYSYCGTAMDLELLDWLNDYTFPEEAKYQDINYAKNTYKYFVNDLKNSATTRASIFATIHNEATLALMDMLEEEKIISYVGKLQMDRNSPDYYCEKDGITNTINFINECKKRNYKYVKPIITPRFTPSVSDSYMEAIGKLANENNLAMQSHLSENLDEIAWVKALRPNDNYYYESYSKYGLFGNNVKTIMAHCIYSSEEERKVMKDNGVFIAHCPTSNNNVIAGICPSAFYLRNNFNIGLGSDVAGGHTLNLLEVMRSAIQSSKFRYKLIDDSIKPLTLSEVLYMATIGGGRFFGNVGLFEKGYEFDAVVIDDSAILNNKDFSYSERLERITYLNNVKILAKFIQGNKII